MKDYVCLGNLTLKVTIHLLRFASAVKCVPFNVTSRTEFRASVFRHGWERYLWYTVNAVIYFHAAFQIATVSHNILSAGLTSNSALQLVCSSLCMISVVFYENALRHASGTVACINQLQRLRELNKGKHHGFHALNSTNRLCTKFVDRAWLSMPCMVL